MEPGGQRAQHERDAARERACVVFAQTEFNGVDGGGDHVGVNAVTDERFECVEDQFLDLLRVRWRVCL